jgi:L-threonylcarbamoyladenylate synthase
VDAAAAILRRGGLVAFPTETVYGLGALASDAAAARRVFAAKGRPADNPLIVHVADPEDAHAVSVVTPLARELAGRFWPGPLTLVLPARRRVPAEVRAGLPTVAVRCPAHALARALIRASGAPVAAPSANRSGRPSPTSAEAVLEDLDGRIDAVLDGGPCARGVESTVVDATGERPRLLRLGAVPAEELGLPPRVDSAGAEASPGTRHRHYAPSIPLHVVPNGAALEAALRAHPGAAVLCGPGEAGRLGLAPGPAVQVWACDPAGRARQVYAALRLLERSGRPAIVAVAPPPAGLDAATADRLWRAAGAGGGPQGAGAGGR